MNQPPQELQLGADAGDGRDDEQVDSARQGDALTPARRCNPSTAGFNASARNTSAQTRTWRDTHTTHKTSAHADNERCHRQDHAWANLTMRSGGMEAGIAAAADHATRRTRQRALEAGARSCSCSESPMSHSIGGHSPTKRARRSALPRSSWSTVFARIHSVMQRPMPASDARCRCQLRGPAWWRIFVNMLHGYPAVAIGARLRGSLGSTARCRVA